MAVSRFVTTSNPIDRTLQLPNNGALYPWIGTSRMRCFGHVKVPDWVIVKSKWKTLQIRDYSCPKTGPCASRSVHAEWGVPDVDSMKMVWTVSAKGVEWLESGLFMPYRSLWPR